MEFQLEIVHAKSGKTLTTLKGVSPQSTLRDVKKEYYKQNSKYYPERQGYRDEPAARRLLKDEQTLESIGLKSPAKLYFKDLGPQVRWTTVFLTEYTGPLVTYLIFYARPAFIYGAAAASSPRPQVVHIAAACWTFHFTKRLLETLFIHRFSHSTMPIKNIFKNSWFYWGFSAFVSYFINHPQYLPPAYGDMQIYAGLAGFLFAELGNFCIHWHLSNLRPAGSKVRRIPYPGLNPFTWLFGLVSCPHYTYETISWISFAAMTQSVPAVLFCIGGFYQMVVWAKEKHRNYLGEFKDYPHRRTTILPFLL